MTHTDMPIIFIRRYFRRLSFCLAAGFICLALPLVAQESQAQGGFVKVDASQSDGKSRAAAQAQAAHGGKVISVSEETRNGRKVYKVKLLLDSGRVKIVTIPG